MDETNPGPVEAKRRLRKRVQQIFSANEFFVCVQPLTFIAYSHGLSTFYIKSDKNGVKQMQHSMWSYCKVLAHITAYNVCYVLTLFNNYESVSGYFLHSHIADFGDFMQIVSGFIGVNIIYLTVILSRKSVHSCYRLMQLIDVQLQAVGVNIMYTKVLRCTYIYLFVMLAINVSYTVGSLELLKAADEQPSAALHVTFILQHTSILVAVVMFSSFTKLLGMRINMLHEVLKNLSRLWDRHDIKTISNNKLRSLQFLHSFSMQTLVTKDPAEIIQESMEIHQLICEAASTGNKYFTYQLLTIISIAFLIIVFDAYYVLETLLGKSKRETKFNTVEFVAFFSCQMILYMIAIISIVEGSSRAKQKSEKTGGIVHSLLNKAKTPDIKEKLQQFSMQLMHLKVNFTAAGLFDIDRTLYFTMSGALTTYLIILLQFTSNTPAVIQGIGNLMEVQTANSTHAVTLTH